MLGTIPACAILPSHYSRGEEVSLATAIAGALKYVRDHKDQVLAELRDFLSIPSVSSNPSDHDEVKRATAWLADRLNSVGMDRVEIVPTKGHAVVYAQSTAAGPSARRSSSTGTTTSSRPHRSATGTPTLIDRRFGATTCSRAARPITRDR